GRDTKEFHNQSHIKVNETPASFINKLKHSYLNTDESNSSSLKWANKKPSFNGPISQSHTFVHENQRKNFFSQPHESTLVWRQKPDDPRVMDSPKPTTAFLIKDFKKG